MAQKGKEGGNNVEKQGVSDQADGMPQGSLKLRVVCPVTSNHSLSCPRQGAALQDRGKENHHVHGTMLPPILPELSNYRIYF